MIRQLALCLTLGVLVVGFAVPANARICRVNVGQAYEAAVENGWGFICSYSNLTINSRKRPGCTVKTGALASVQANVMFFCSDGSHPGLRNGWELHGYRIDDPIYRQLTPTSVCLVHFKFNAKGPFRTERRYLARLWLKKDGGDCSNVIEEAF